MKWLICRNDSNNLGTSYYQLMPSEPRISGLPETRLTTWQSLSSDRIMVHLQDELTANPAASAETAYVGIMNVESLSLSGDVFVPATIGNLDFLCDMVVRQTKIADDSKVTIASNKLKLTREQVTQMLDDIKAIRDQSPGHVAFRGSDNTSRRWLELFALLYNIRSVTAPKTEQSHGDFLLTLNAQAWGKDMEGLFGSRRFYVHSGGNDVWADFGTANRGVNSCSLYATTESAMQQFLRKYFRLSTMPTLSNGSRLRLPYIVRNPVTADLLFPYDPDYATAFNVVTNSSYVPRVAIAKPAHPRFPRIRRLVGRLRRN